MKRIIAVFAIAAVLLFVIGGIIYVYQQIPKTAYIETAKVFDSFKLKKELEEKINIVQSARKSILDSLMIQIRILTKKNNQEKINDSSLPDKLNFLQERYFSKKKEFEEENSILANKYNDQIWQQLNQYINDYGTGNNYMYIFGAAAQGNLMYALDKKDITNEVILYVNDRYSGKSK